MFIVNEIIVLLASNLILMQALGTSTLFIAAGSRKQLLTTAGIITIFTTTGSAAAFVCDKITGGEKVISLLMYTVSVGVLYMLLLSALYFFSRELFVKIRRYIHISAFNCAVMGTLFTISGKAAQDSALMHFGSYVGAGLQAGAGFVIAALILSAAYGRLCSAEVPASFRGFPAMLIYLGIISMAVYALS